MSLPLILTLLRIVMSPIFLIVYLYPAFFALSPTVLPYVLLLILSLCEISDFFDGFIARKYNTVTDLGKILDPMADSIFRLSVFFTFTQGVVGLPLLLVLIIFFRESIISSLRTLCALRGIALAARWSGKIKAVVQAVCIYFILLLMIPYTKGCLNETAFQQVSFYAALVATLYTVVSGLEYIWAHRSYIKKTFEKL